MVPPARPYPLIAPFRELRVLALLAAGQQRWRFAVVMRSWWLIRDTPRACSIWVVSGAMIWLAVVLPPRPGRGIGYVMCMQPAAWPEPDPLIAAAIAAKYSGKRPRPLRSEEHTSELQSPCNLVC